MKFNFVMLFIIKVWEFDICVMKRDGIGFFCLFVCRYYDAVVKIMKVLVCFGWNM